MPLISLSTNIDADPGRISRESKIIARLIKVFWKDLGEILKGVIVEGTLGGHDVNMHPFADSIVTDEPIPWVQTGLLMTSLKAKPDTKNLNAASVAIFPAVRYGFILDKGIPTRGKMTRGGRLRKQLISNNAAINRKEERIEARGRYWRPSKLREIEGELQALYRKRELIEEKIRRNEKYGMELPPVPSRPWIGATDDQRVDAILRDYIMPFFDHVIEVVSNLPLGGGLGPLQGWVKTEMKRKVAESKDKIKQLVSARITKVNEDGGQEKR